MQVDTKIERKYFPLILFFLAIPLLGWSQEYKFQHITTIDGLSHNEVRKIVKDSRGFLWFGTQNGLNRYDGYRFKIFKNDLGDSTTIKGNTIYSLTTSKDRLWVGTVTGLSVINTITLDVIPTPGILNKIGDNAVLQLYFDGSNNQVWASTENENFLIDVETLNIVPFLEGYKIASMAKDFNNMYWIGTDKGLLKYEYESSTIVKNYGVGIFNAYGLNRIYTNPYGEVWISLQDNIYRYQSERDRFIEVHRSKSVNGITENNKGEIFFGTYGNGLIKYARDSGIFETLSANPENHSSISSNDVYDVYVDNENILWVGTQEGLDYYDYSRHRFNSLVHLPENKNSLRSSFVQTLFQDTDGTFWIGTREGIDQVNFEEAYSNPKITHFNIDIKGFEALNKNYITRIYRDSKERMWIATMANGLFLMHEDRKVYKHFLHNKEDENSIASASVRAILEDRSGRIWFGTGGGLSLLKESLEGDYSFENFGYSKYNSNSLPLNDIFSVFEDSKHRIWVGMNKGGVSLLQENGGGKSFLRFNHNPNDPQSLSNDEVFVIHEDAKQRVWFGTSAGGLNLLRENGPANNRYYFQRFTENEGLADNEVNSILEDKDGDLWIATNTGFSEFNIEEETFNNYSTYDGVLKGKFRKNASWQTQEGTLFFGGAAGINFFDPNNFVSNKIIPDPVFIDLIIDGKVVKIGDTLDGTLLLAEPLNSGSVIRLPAKANRFQVEFTSLSYASPYRNQYAYKLEGVDKDWIRTSGKDPSARYPKPKSGRYRFYLKASNNDGIWNDRPIYLDIVVSANFMDRNIAKMGIVLLILIAIILGILAFKKYRGNTPSRHQNINHKKPQKPIDPLLESENLNKITELNFLMETEMIYMDATLGLSELAEKLKVTNNHLSILLNDYIGKNFYDYINSFRVEEVKRRLKDPHYQKQTLSSIGGDCGFNSKSAFNRIFKGFTGKTPSEYQNMHRE
ncbi:MAG TPA: two-component regulator propeller domain-containing protein [Arenibacter sp.]|nr:two-component regulator propeller domain-containing protein [Arenibacter sp.]